MNRHRRAVLYLRVSTAEKQTPENQEKPLRDYCAAEGLSVVATYIDHASGAKGPRPQYDQMKRDAYRGRFDVLVFWAMDRFSRAGAMKTIAELEAFTAAGVQWRSLKEPHLSTTEPHGQLVLMVLTWVAAQERVRMVDRVNAGLARAKADGKTLGRPRVELTADQMKCIREGRAAGASIRNIAVITQLSQTTVFRFLEGDNHPNAKTATNTDATDRTRGREADDAIPRDVRAAARPSKQTRGQGARSIRD